MTGEPAKDNVETAPADGDEKPKGLAPSRHAIDTQLRSILCDVLGLDADDVEAFDGDTGLFGHLPELDSMAVAGLLTEMEDRMDIIIEDDDVDGEMLETYGGLLAFAEVKAIEG
jgi:acyl carrier protein